MFAKVICQRHTSQKIFNFNFQWFSYNTMPGPVQALLFLQLNACFANSLNAYV